MKSTLLPLAFISAISSGWVPCSSGRSLRSIISSASSSVGIICKPLKFTALDRMNCSSLRHAVVIPICLDLCTKMRIDGVGTLCMIGSIAFNTISANSFCASLSLNGTGVPCLSLTKDSSQNLSKSSMAAKNLASVRSSQCSYGLTIRLEALAFTI